MSLFIDDIAPPDLRALVERSYTAELFGDARIVPLRPLEPGVFVLGLSNGPTLAFKDVAMQFLGNAFEYELARRGRTLNVLGATSGDTGSAAEYAMRGKRGVHVFMLSPHGRMSPFQQAQMFSLQDANIHNIAIEGVFDDCQDMVKAVSADLAFKERHAIGTVNSINWARLLAQVVYYFAGFFQATERDDEPVDFAVPTGNFGNICAGHVARIDGAADPPPGAGDQRERRPRRVLPHRHLPRAQRRRDARDVEPVDGHLEGVATSSASCSTLLGRDAARTRALFAEVETRRAFALTPAERERVAGFGFVSGRSTSADRLATIRDVHRRFGEVIDPHTADALKVARDERDPATPMIVLETALAAKFNATIRAAIGSDAPRPARLAGLEDLPQRVVRMPADVVRLKAFIAENDRR